jgi:hypothetical protein
MAEIGVFYSMHSHLMQKLDVNFGFKENAYVLVAWSSGIVSA